ncbi:MAG: CDP-alcohol phosphatidyltransferase family protein [Verrucomicrobia bacterium]|nr:CDP-alcohol phosphatidyltransferase family protein [Verrucomicrobiota bacterium]
MSSIYLINPKFQRLLQPTISFLYKSKVTPNQVTIFTTLFSITFGLYFIYAGKESWWMMPIVLLVRIALNAIDGMMAKQYQIQSLLGAYLTEMGDMISDFFLYLPFAFEFPWIMAIMLLLSLMSEVAGVLAHTFHAERRYDGPMGKSDRAFCLGSLGFLMSFDLISPLWATIIFTLISCLLCLTIFFRVRNAITR